MKHVLALLLAASPVLGQFPAQPAPPGKFQTTVRYRIPAPRDNHVALYDAMIRHLQKLNFEFEPPLEEHPKTDREDRSKNQLQGKIGAANALKILADPSVATLLLVPESFKMPDQPEQRVLVRLELAGELLTEQHRELGQQVRQLLMLLGFEESAGYDNRGYAGRPFMRLVGSMPAGAVDQLLKDLRNQPTDWFEKVFDRGQLPQPLRQVNPIRVVEILNDPEPTREPPFQPFRDPPYLDKVSPDLWDLMQNPKAQGDTVRVQLFLIGNHGLDDKTLRYNLAVAAPTLVLDGVLGNVYSGSVLVSQLRNLAAEAIVSVLRQSRPRRVDAAPGAKIDGDNAQALKLTGLDAFHKQGHQGQGQRIAIIDPDFRGWEKLVQDKKLPASTRLVDLTAERDPNVFAEPYPNDGVEIGHGVQLALAALLAAPRAEVVLVRIDGYDPYQLYEVNRYLQGGQLSESLTRRQDELLSYREGLKNRREALNVQRKVILENFADESDLHRYYGFMGPVVGWIFSDREWLYLQNNYQAQLEKELADRYGRFLKLSEQVQSLNGIPIGVTALSWADGYPAGGASGLSRFFANQRDCKTLWFQAVGNTRGQAWTGMVLDRDRNGILELGDKSKLPKDRWTNELDFLAFSGYNGVEHPEFPAGAKIRVTFQWREPHDPDYFTRSTDDDPYRFPLAPMRLTLLRQRDPEAKQLPADAFEVIGRSMGIPQRLEHEPGHSIYEQVLEVTLPKAGRYAIQAERQLDRQWTLRGAGQRIEFDLLEGLLSTGTRPVGAPTLPALERKWDLKARLFVDLLDDLSRQQGRPVLLDFVTDEGTITLPADSRNLLSVGAADFQGKPRPYSAFGAPAFLELTTRPTVLGYDALAVVSADKATAVGSSLATPFTAGMAAALLSAGQTPAQVAQRLAPRSK